MYHSARSLFSRPFVALLAVLALIALTAPLHAADDAPARNWWTFEGDHGDKPGIGYLLVEHGGKVTAAHLFILANSGSDSQSGGFYRVSNIKQAGNRVAGEAKLFDASKGPNGSEVLVRIDITLLDGFDKAPRLRANITTTSAAAGAEPVKETLTFVLQGDQWK